jgi:hypothetical protein
MEKELETASIEISTEQEQEQQEHVIMNIDQFTEYMDEKGLKSSVQRQKCRDIFREGWPDEAIDKVNQLVSENNKRPHVCPLTGIII